MGQTKKTFTLTLELNDYTTYGDIRMALKDAIRYIKDYRGPREICEPFDGVSSSDAELKNRIESEGCEGSWKIDDSEPSIETLSAALQPFADIYRQALSLENQPYDITKVTVPIEILRNAAAALDPDMNPVEDPVDVCITGNPAVNGVCGDPDCVCATSPKADDEPIVETGANDERNVQ